VPVEMRDDDPEYPALTLADWIYGGSLHSRIWERLREKEGLSYGTFSLIDADSFDKRALFLSSAICAPQNAKKALVGIIEELGRFVDKGIPEAELKEEKKSYQARFDTDLANDGAVEELLDESLFAGRTLGYYAQLNKKIQSLSGREVVATMKKWVKPESLIKIQVGDL
jgi:zinc protease